MLDCPNNGVLLLLLLFPNKLLLLLFILLLNKLFWFCGFWFKFEKILLELLLLLNNPVLLKEEKTGCEFVVLKFPNKDIFKVKLF